MESFLDKLLADKEAGMPQAGAAATVATADGSPAAPHGSAAPRIAVYDTLTSPPRVLTVEAEDVPALIASLAEKTYHACREQGGQVPYTVINELIENLIHAYFRDLVVTILDGGQVIRIADHGPGSRTRSARFCPGSPRPPPSSAA